MAAFITNYWTILRQTSRDVRMYLLTATLFGLSYFGFVTVLLNLYLLRLEYGPAFIGLANGGTALAFAVCSLPAGAIGDRWGYRRSVVLGVTLVGAGASFLPLAEFLPDILQDGGIIFTRLMSGLGFALYSVNANPYLVAATKDDERNHIFSMRVALPPLTGFIGSLIAGFMPDLFAAMLNLSLDDPAPFRYPLILSGLLLTPAIFGLLTIQDIDPVNEPINDTDQTRRLRETVTEAAPYAIIAFLAVTALLRMSGEGAGRTFFNVYLDDGLGVPTSRIGLMTAFSQLLAGPAALAAPLLIGRVGKIWAIVISTGATAVFLIVMGIIPHWAIVSLGFTGVISMRAVTQSVTMVVQMEIVPPRWRGKASGAISMAMGSGFSLMALGGGYAIPLIGYQGLYFSAAGLVTLSAVIFWAYFRIPRGEYAQTNEASSR
ncbi:MAG: MFS transporter [Chloroflexota bacterium]